MLTLSIQFVPLKSVPFYSPEYFTTTVLYPTVLCYCTVLASVWILDSGLMIKHQIYVHVRYCTYSTQYCSVRTPGLRLTGTRGGVTFSRLRYDDRAMSQSHTRQTVYRLYEITTVSQTEAASTITNS